MLSWSYRFRWMQIIGVLSPVVHFATILFLFFMLGVCLPRRQHWPISGSMPCVSRWLLLVLFSPGCIRFGEALHPGPSDQAATHDFCIGCFNPSGLAGKAQVINEYLNHGDLWLVAETHLSTRSLSSFRKSLRVTQSPFQYIASGYPVPVRLHSHSSGGWKGVAALSKHPTRTQPVGWDDDVKFSSRAMLTSTLLHDMWITAGTLYGESAGTWHPYHLQNNDKLLRAIATQVCIYSTGLRVVAGDFNLAENDVQAFSILEASGFKDLQSIAADRWGHVIQNTCKSATRVDFCYISPELQSLLQSVTLTQDLWPDHAVLAGCFRGSVRSIPRFVWRQPQQLQWPDYDIEPLSEVPVGCSTEVYRQLWTDAEAAASSRSDVPVPKACKGRARVIAPKCVYGQSHAPLKAPRAGELQPQYFGSSLKHAHWYRQARRLQAYLRFAQANRPDADESHAAKVWGSIKRAKGFESGFGDWWQQCQFRTHGAPDLLPCCPPNAAIAKPIYDSFVLAFRQLESDLKATCRATARARRLLSPNLVFHDIRQCSSNSVDLLMNPLQATVTAIDEEQASLTLDCAVPWDWGGTHLCGGPSL